MPPRVFNIPPSAPFLPTLIEALTGGKLGFRRPERSARARRRNALSADAARLPAGARRFSRRAYDRGGDPAAHRRHRRHRRGRDRLRRSGRRRPCGEKRWICRRRSAAWKRRLLLTQLVRDWARAPRKFGARGACRSSASPTAASALAEDLARLIDDMTMREVSWDRLDGLVPDVLDPYWQIHAEIPAARARELAGDAARTRRHRAGRAPRRVDQGRSRAAWRGKPKRR